MNQWTRWFGAVAIGTGSALTTMAGHEADPLARPVAKAETASETSKMRNGDVEIRRTIKADGRVVLTIDFDQTVPKTPSDNSLPAMDILLTGQETPVPKVPSDKSMPILALPEVKPPAESTNSPSVPWVSTTTTIEEPAASSSLLWAEADLLLWWFRETTLPALATSGSPTDIVPGALNQAGTSTIIGNESRNGAMRTGGRFRFGSAIAGGVGWEAGGFYVDPQSSILAVNSTQVPVLARPFYDTVANTEGSFILGFPGAFRGGITTKLQTNLYGFEANATLTNDEMTGTLFAGFRFMNMTDHLSVLTNYQMLPGGLAFINGVGLLTGATGNMEDKISVRNNFYGGQIGWRGHMSFGDFALDLRSSLAVGVVRSRTTIAGQTSVLDADGTASSAPGGVFTQASNMGTYNRSRLTVIPELNARLSYAFTRSISVFAGYDFLYWGSVVRATDQYDRVVDTRQMPTSANYTGAPGSRPTFRVQDTAFWAHGLSFGVRFQY